MDSYVITDRTTATKYAISVDNGMPLFTVTTDATSAEPIVEDAVNAGVYWKVFIDDGQPGIEITATVQDDSLIFTDSTLGIGYLLAVSDGQINFIATTLEVRISVRSVFESRISKYFDEDSQIEKQLNINSLVEKQLNLASKI